MIDKTLTKHLADLSMLSLSDTELDEMTRNMTDIITLMDKACDFNDSSKPYTQKSVPFTALRCDDFKASFSNNEILKNSGNTNNSYFTVPKIV